ncbi:MAG: amidohydrolase family protein [Chloroflexota bacterium]|nr:amidohydrolase family protein [Chloroflexota bacterium]
MKIITAAQVIDGSGAPPIKNAVIVVKGDEIEAVVRDRSLVNFNNMAVEEYRYDNATILPGLIDGHVHLIGFGDGRPGDDLNNLPDEILTLQAAKNARTHLYSGVTTVRDCGAKNNTTFMLRQAVEMGITPSPRLILSGRPVSIIGGHLSYFGVQVTGETECRAIVRQLIKEGADFIKITATGGTTSTSFPMKLAFTSNELRSICDEAHKFGKLVGAHCVSSMGIVNALDAGVDTIFHARFNEPNGIMCFQKNIADRIASQGVFVNPTLHVKRARIWAFEKKANSVGLTKQEQIIFDGHRKEYEENLLCFRGLLDAGVKMVTGSDSAWGNYKMGGFTSELDATVEAGLSARETIVSATSSSSLSCGLENEIGTLSAGRKADMIVVKGDPTKEIKAVDQILDVFQNGNCLDRSVRL